MKLVNSHYGLEIKLEENYVNVIVSENASTMSRLVNDLINQCMGMEGNFVLSDNKILKMEKESEIIVNPFQLDFGNKKILNALYSGMIETAINYEMDKSKINSELIELLDNISIDQTYSGISYSLDLEWTSIFKMYNVHLDDDYEDLITKITEYIKVLSCLCHIHILFLINIKSFLTVEELQALYLCAHYNKINLVLLETTETEKIVGENIIILDKDDCLIVK